MQLKHNILKMHLLQAVLWFMVAMPIIVLFFQEHGLSLTEVMTLQAIYSFSVAICEIPSGYIADNYSLETTFYTLALIVGIFSIISSIQLYLMDKNHSFAS